MVKWKMIKFREQNIPATMIQKAQEQKNFNNSYFYATNISR